MTRALLILLLALPAWAGEHVLTAVCDQDGVCREENRPHDICPDVPNVPVPLAEWVRVFGLELPPLLAVADIMIIPVDTALYFGENPDGKTIHLNLGKVDVTNKRQHAGILMHEIAHRYCGTHWISGSDKHWQKCAEGIGVPTDYAQPNPPEAYE